MESINLLLNGTEKQPTKLVDTKNPMQALYFDLLSCLSGGDHPRLPQGYKLQPMTGFLDIVEAFNDVSSGIPGISSGIVCEVGSNEFVKDNLLPASIGLEPRQSGQSKVAEAEDCGQHETFYNADLELENENFVEALLTTEKQTHLDEWKILHENIVNTETFHDALDTFKLERDQDSDVNAEMGSQRLFENGILMEQSALPHENSHYHDADLNLSSLNSAHDEISTMEEEIDKYSNELREIELMLKEHLVFPAYSRQNSKLQVNSLPERTTNVLHPNFQLVDGSIVQELADGLMSPSSALEIMYDMESTGSSRNPPSVHTSTYDSCTSFTSWQTQPSVNSFLDSNNASGNAEKMRQFSKACPSEPSPNNNVQFKRTSDSINSASHLEKVSVTDHFSKKTDSDRGNGFHLLADMVNKFTTKTDINANVIGYYSVNKENDAEEFVDTDDSTQKEWNRKIRFHDKLPTIPERERAWSSASCSENEEASNGAKS